MPMYVWNTANEWILCRTKQHLVCASLITSQLVCGHTSYYITPQPAVNQLTKAFNPPTHHDTSNTINVERFAGLNIHSFGPIKFFTEILCGALASSVYYLTIAKYSQENFCGTLKIHKKRESLAQWIFPRLQ